jgi:hypothetical protein
MQGNMVWRPFALWRKAPFYVGAELFFGRWKRKLK